MCPTVEIAGWKASRNRFGITDLTGLNYIPFYIKCHFIDKIKENVIEKMKELKAPLRILKDDQCFLVEDGKIEFIGDSEEVIL